MQMERLIISLFLFCYCVQINAQQYIAKVGEISFFSNAPLEDFTAVNNKVSAVYDVQTHELVFQLNIAKLMIYLWVSIAFLSRFIIVLAYKKPPK